MNKTPNIYPTDPTTIRSEARNIEIGAPDGDGYAGHLRACADTIEDLEAKLKGFTSVFGEDFPDEEIDWLAPFISRFTLDNGSDGKPEIHICLDEGTGPENWIVKVGSDKLLNKHGELEEDRWYDPADWEPMFKEDLDRVTSKLPEAFARAKSYMEKNLDIEVEP